MRERKRKSLLSRHVL